MNIPLFYPHIPGNTAIEIAKVLEGKWIGQGDKVEEFEQAIGAKFNLKYPLFVNSGTSGLELSYELLNLKPGDEVITTPLSCTATNIPLLRRGIKIVWADIYPTTLCLNPHDVKNKITKKTKAIVNVDLGGVRSDIGKMPVPVVTDAAQAIGANHGDYVVYSFQAIKHFTTADGGLLACPTKNDYIRAKKLRWFGIDRDKKAKAGWQAYKERQMTFDIEEAGFKYQPTNIDAVMGLCGLAEYDKILAHRKEIFTFYKTELDNFHGITVVDGEENVYWLATLLVPNRDEFAKRLAEAGIETNLVQLRNDIFKIFGGKRQNLPGMDYVEDKYISIPLHTHMTMSDAEYIVKTIKGIYE